MDGFAYSHLRVGRLTSLPTLAQMTTQAFAGVVYNSPEGVITHLPLREVKVHALIVDGE